MWIMKKSIRGCISCILPCGALDVIRIVHSNARVEEITTCTIKAADVMRAHPNHVLKNLSSPNLLIVSPHADLRRGNIYFLVPIPPLPTNTLQQHIRSSPPSLTQALTDPAVLFSRSLTSTLSLSRCCHPLVEFLVLLCIV
ncbi:hypothetical protein Ahy_B04g072125 [Arachis hypogaea]|uniref:Uncharacterized protein n=1 Tax=Arachis hypogaea TaxID=3818 RepID=A0A444ZMJ8_ARAHY|nr:hypothetical protein Ahy_B04g072125 [Arachis hypogaea]